MCWPLTKVNDYYFGPKQGKRLMCVSHNKSCTFVCIKNYIFVCVCVYVCECGKSCENVLDFGLTRRQFGFFARKTNYYGQKESFVGQKGECVFLCVTYTTWFLVYCCYCNCCCVFYDIFSQHFLCIPNQFAKSAHFRFFLDFPIPLLLLLHIPTVPL